MTAAQPRIVWEKSDRLLSGTILAIRAVALPEQDEEHGAVAVTAHVPPGSVRVEDDGAGTVTLLLGPEEALGLSAWLREASQSAETVGPPLLTWDE
jgi:hypothetical protein